MGATKYDSLPEKLHLQGPLNDVELFSSLLIEKFDFPARNIVRLSDAEGAEDRRPLKANIERDLKRLATQAQAGDQVVVLLAGHGTQQPDDNPEDPNDSETDGMDEVYLPADSGAWDNSASSIKNAITDDQIRRWLEAIRGSGASVWAIVDSCHSGTIVRGNEIETLRQLTPRELGIPADAIARAVGRVRPAEPQRLRPGVFDIAGAPDAGGLAAIYAAQSSEPTFERPFPLEGKSQDQKPYGLLSYTLCSLLRRSSSPMTYAELVQRVHQQYVAWGLTYPTPLVEGNDQHREVMGLREWPERSRMLLAVDQGRLRVSAGQLHGLTAGSVLAIYPRAGEDNADQRQGYVRVAAVGALSSEIEPYADDKFSPALVVPAAKTAGMRAEIVFVDFGLQPLALAVEGEGLEQAELDEVRSQLKARFASDRSLVRLAADPASAHWLLRLDKPSARAILVPAAGLVVRSGQAPHSPQSFGPFPLGEQLPESASSSLNQIARVTNLLSLAEPEGAERFTRRGRGVKLELLRRAGADQPEQVANLAADGFRLKVGEQIAFRITNPGREAIDVTLLFINSEFGILAHFPREGTTTDNRLDPQQLYTTRWSTVTTATGREHMLAIAVTSRSLPIDFTWLRQSSLKLAEDADRLRAVAVRGGDADAWSSPLARLLQQASFGTGIRGLDDQAVEDHSVRVISWHVE